MTTLVYLLGYLGVLGFAVTSIMKIMKYVKSTPLHVRWELYPVPHEGERAKHGGSYLEEFEWWKEKRHIDHLGDLKALIMEVFFLEATFHHNKPLWIRTYPFHFGLYMLMGGAILLFLMAIIRSPPATRTPSSASCTGFSTSWPSSACSASWAAASASSSAASPTRA